ncbi:hypothetical protein B296_00054464 [Ensete ventricosum]|uniref:Uncharacterized protein n=1 Tax=Ensete ventricosum TaxID=4639 RepID=A0A426X7C3_ENSVE|nr:hypothetical protein B296_00054464 [Ensete ventricosum]
MYSFQNQDLELQFLLSFCHVLHQIVVSFVAMWKICIPTAIKLDRSLGTPPKDGIFIFIFCFEAIMYTVPTLDLMFLIYICLHAG